MPERTPTMEIHSTRAMWNEGMAMARIRLMDKLNRFKKLSRNPETAQVKDESIRDTLIDLANYAMMTVLEMDEEKARSNMEGTINEI